MKAERNRLAYFCVTFRQSFSASSESLSRKKALNDHRMSWADSGEEYFGKQEKIEKKSKLKRILQWPNYDPTELTV